MYGGDHNYVLQSMKNIDHLQKSTSLELKKTYLLLKSKLNSFNKNIDPKDDKSITALLNKFSDNEKQLLDGIKTLNIYTHLLERYGDSVDKDQTILSWDKVKESVKKLHKPFGKYVNRQDNLLSILRTLTDATNELLIN
jgi:hypothetical protein